MISRQDLGTALEIQHKERRKLTDVLVSMGFMTAEGVATQLSLYMGIPLIDLKRHTVQSRVVNLVQERTAREHLLIPLDIVSDSLVVVMADPRDLGALDDLSLQTNLSIKPAVGYPSQIKDAIDIYYRAMPEIERQVHDYGLTILDDTEAWESLISQSPVVRTLDLIISQAVRDRASDIHIEPQIDRLRVRFRIDGILHDAMILPSTTLDPLVSRIKVLAGMNITERRRPQGGQLTFDVDGREVDLRAATIETAHGETMVIRILDKSLPFFTLPDLGFPPSILASFRRALVQPHGIVLVSGPTGAGKTTTLYASVAQIDRGSKNIMTIEDPVEYLFEDIKQTQVNDKAGITFSSGLRAMMRMDPDVILVGEIRDSDTAKTAIQAALTGHLVLSSIHANDAASVPARLVELGVEPYLVASVLIATLAQRMVRSVCRHCRDSFTPSPEELAAYQEEMGTLEGKFSYGSKCNLCSNTGFLGRTGIYELMNCSKEIKRMILDNHSLIDLKAQAISEGMITLRRDAMMKAGQGTVTLGEVLGNIPVT
ncbi:MAG TPA: GspE/PulE family protein [Dehalococcoidia bacterium]|nr:GspE/PulE family protein [Dehalococcoidia bacterium]